MTPDAAAVLAQVDTGLLVSIVIEAKGLPQRDQDRQPNASNDRSWVITWGLYGLIFSLFITLASVLYAKPLGDAASEIAGSGTVLGTLPLFYIALQHLRLRGVLRSAIALVVLVTLTIWFAIWVQNFVPGGFLGGLRRLLQ